VKSVLPTTMCAVLARGLHECGTATRPANTARVRSHRRSTGWRTGPEVAHRPTATLAMATVTGTSVDNCPW
jgi:hypothetical protein